jgi:2,3-dihydroxybenzoate-AMP ligase
MTKTSEATRAVGAYGAMAERYRASGDWAGVTLVQAFRRSAARRPGSLAVASVEGSLTYEELDRRSDLLALGLVEAGLEPGDPVVFQMGVELETVVALYGVLKAGLIPVCSIPNHRLHEVGEIAAATRARAHLFQADYRDYDLIGLSAELGARNPAVALRIVARGQSAPGLVSLDELLEGRDPSLARSSVEAIQSELTSEDLAVYQLSGGTTGVPKVIPHTHDTYLSVAQRWSANLGWDERSVNLHFLPIMHHAGLGTALVPTHFVGGTLVLGRSVDAALLVELIERYGVTWMHFNLAAFRPLKERSAEVPCDFSSITHFSWTFVRPELSAQAEEMLGAVAVGSFGMGEGVHLSARRDDPAEIRRFTVGSLIGANDEVVVRRPGTEEPVADGEVGELTFRGPSVIRAYLSAEDSESSFTADGFLKSGDLGRALEIEGRRVYSIDGRLKDQISRGGEKFMAAELELLLSGHGAVREVAAVGIPDAALGERVCVVVVPEADAAGLGAEQLRDQLVGFLDERSVAKFKWPERLVLVEALPKTAIGKVRKDVLRQQVMAQLGIEEQRS